MSHQPFPTHSCSDSPRLADGSCAGCAAIQLAHPQWPAVPLVTMVAKTPGIAVLLSLLWFGAGHLYANRTGTGIVLIVVEALIGCLALTGVGLIVAVPLWIVMAPVVAALAAGAATDYNRRNGLVLR